MVLASFVEPLYLYRGQRPDLPRLQRAQSEGSHPNPAQCLDRVSHGVKQLPNLSLPAFEHRHRVAHWPRSPGTVCAEQPDVGRSRRDALQIDAPQEPPSLGCGQQRGYDHQVFLLHAEAGVGQALDQRAVVRQQQEAVGVLVEPAGRSEPWGPQGGGHEVHHRRPPSGV